MKIEYIYHSGFTLETENYYFVFDYYKGSIDLKDKKTIVFSTHSHHDHYNEDIFDWAEENPQIMYVLSSDIKAEESKQVHILNEGEHLRLFDVDIKSFGSTDLGLSLLIQADGKTIFFAGDLNWWYWDDDSDEEKISMENAFKEEVNKLKGTNIDLAFFPVDPRLEDSYYKGGHYFINTLQPKHFFPMHFGDKYDVIPRFIHKMSDSDTNIVEISEKNQVFEIE